MIPGDLLRFRQSTFLWKDERTLTTRSEPPMLVVGHVKRGELALLVCKLPSSRIDVLLVVTSSKLGWISSELCEALS